MSPAPTVLDIGAAWAEDDSRSAIVLLGKALSGETIAERQGREPSEPQRKTSHELAGLFVAALAPFRALLAEQGKRIDAVTSAASSPLPVLPFADGDSFTAGTIDGIDIAARTISGERFVVDAGRAAPDNTVKMSGQIAVALRAGVRGELRGLVERVQALEAAMPTAPWHRAVEGRAGLLCGEAPDLVVPPGLGDGVEAGTCWTTDALAVTCPECHLAQLVEDDNNNGPESGPILLSPTTAGRMEASPVRAAAPWSAPGLDVSELIEAARAAVIERNWRPALPAIPGDRELFFLAGALGMDATFALPVPLPFVGIEHAESARKVCGSDAPTMGKLLVVELETTIGRGPSDSHLEALARHLEHAAQTVRTWSDR